MVGMDWGCLTPIWTLDNNLTYSLIGILEESLRHWSNIPSITILLVLYSYYSIAIATAIKLLFNKYLLGLTTRHLGDVYMRDWYRR